MDKAIIFDRDGTLIKDKGYIKDIKKVFFYNIDFEKLREINKKFLFFIVTNQSGISKGITSLDDVKVVNSYIMDFFLKKNIIISELFFCPHQDIDNCDCKKPKQRFLNIIKEKYKIDQENSFMIGDHPSDILFGDIGGLNNIYLLTGHGKKHLKEVKKLNNRVIIKRNINYALDYIKEFSRIKIEA